jgi:deoxyribonuclease-4
MPITGSIDRAVDRALELKTNTFQIFTRSPRGWKYPPLPEEAVEAFKKKVKENGFKGVASHMPYLPNLASPDKEIFQKSVDSLIEEIRRANLLGLDYIVVHLGSHMGKGIEFGRRRVAEAIIKAIEAERPSSMILLENMAGQKNSVGASFEDLRKMLDEMGDRRVGVCFDTCHAYAAGYDLSTKRAVEETVRRFDEVVGLDRLKVVHLNDSKGGLGSKLDRHERIGKGFIGRKGFEAIINHEELIKVPMILETPVSDYREYGEDLKVLRSLIV